MQYYKIAVNTPFNRSILTYVSDEFYNRGDLVSVPLGKRKERGCVLGIVKKPVDDGYELKSIIGLIDEQLKLSADHLDFISWCAKYYHYPLGQHIFDILPKTMKKPRPFISNNGKGNDLKYELTKGQDSAIRKVFETFNSFKKFLLHGVTGSGKTSVYIELIKKNSSMGKNTLLLIPEINLTPGLIKNLEDTLNISIYSYHSSVTGSQKYGLWLSLKEEKSPYVIVAVRSGIFLPVSKLGLIIVDEEHDGSYKQEDRCPYHARDLAVKLASLNSCPVVLGSATPSFETYDWAMHHLDYYLHLSERPSGVSMPVINICDRRESKLKGEEDFWPFTKGSIDEINNRVTRGEQVIIFVNRLGFASYVQCRSCGHQFLCKNCSLSLKYFKSTNEMKCSTCDYKEVLPLSCPECGNLKLLQKGFGTERLEQVLKGHLSHVNIGRFDREAIKNFKQMNETLDKFNSGGFDVLIGTQMLSKGHNFTNVNYVLVLGVDSQLNFPDFRANENAYQLITQISGRSGRFGKEGHVVIESYNPENKIFKQIKDYSFKDFYSDELKLRSVLNLPPYSRLCAIYFVAKNRSTVADYCKEVRGIADLIQGKHFTSVDIIGLRPAVVEKREGKFSWTMLFRSQVSNDLHNFTTSVLNNLPSSSKVSVKIDMDPQHIY